MADGCEAHGGALRSPDADDRLQHLDQKAGSVPRWSCHRRRCACWSCLEGRHRSDSCARRGVRRRQSPPPLRAGRRRGRARRSRDSRRSAARAGVFVVVRPGEREDLDPAGAWPRARSAARPRPATRMAECVSACQSWLEDQAALGMDRVGHLPPAADLVVAPEAGDVGAAATAWRHGRGLADEEPRRRALGVVERLQRPGLASVVGPRPRERRERDAILQLEAVEFARVEQVGHLRAPLHLAATLAPGRGVSREGDGPAPSGSSARTAGSLLRGSEMGG